MKHRIAVLTAIAMAGIPATASAQTTGECPNGQVRLHGVCVEKPSATVTIITDKAACKATVNVVWQGKHTHPGGTQVNIDNLGRQDDAKQLSDPGGHTLVKVPSSHTYTFTLAKNAAHVIDAWTVAGPVKVRELAYLDCSTPVPPRVVEVPGPERLVEVAVPGPSVEVPKLVTRYVIHYRTKIKYRTRYKTRTLKVCPRPKPKFAG